MLPRNKPKKVFVNDGAKRIKILPEELDLYLKDGWIKGFGNF